MENNTKISDRIKQIIDYKKLTINKFSDSVGASNSYFNKLIKNHTTIGSDKIENILRTYSEINPDWLITGNGNMLREYKENESSLNFTNEPMENYESAIVLKLKNEIEILKNKNEILKDKNQLLLDKIEFLNEKIQFLSKKN